MKLDIIYNEDCMGLQGMKRLPDSSIDMVLCDMPYGTTACKWDTIIPLEPLWEQLKRVIKPNGAIVLTASQPFTSKLVMSNLKMFKYEWIWHKDRGTNFLNAKKQPLRNHEQVITFYSKQPTYNQQYTKGKPSHSIGKSDGKLRKGTTTGNFIHRNADLVSTRKNAKTVQYFPVPYPPIHPTQKPVALMEYLIKTYTNRDEVVLDFAIGSGTTAVACKRLNRRYIGFEIEKKYYDITIKRLEAEKTLWD